MRREADLQATLEGSMVAMGIGLAWVLALLGQDGAGRAEWWAGVVILLAMGLWLARRSESREEER